MLKIGEPYIYSASNWKVKYLYPTFEKINQIRLSVETIWTHDIILIIDIIPKDDEFFYCKILFKDQIGWYIEHKGNFIDYEKIG